MKGQPCELQRSHVAVVREALAHASTRVPGPERVHPPHVRWTTWAMPSSGLMGGGDAWTKSLQTSKQALEAATLGPQE
eukprot:2535520-Alexandrium_andersonii.AAC.1